MGKTKLFSLAGLLLTFAAFTAGCDGEDRIPVSDEITVADENTLTQDVYADETSAASVSFTTPGPWTSEITSKTITRAQTPDWISIDPSSGSKAGDYTIALTLAENTTGADRGAVITISSGETAIEISVTQKYTKEDGSANVTVDQMIENYVTFYGEAMETYVETDRLYSTLAARQAVTASTAELYGFWTKAYGAIDACNLLTEHIDLHETMSAMDRDIHRYTAVMYRENLHACLSTLFGAVPFVNSSDNSWTALQPATKTEIMTAVHAGMDQAAIFLSAADVIQARCVSAFLHMNAGNTVEARAQLEALINKIDGEGISFTDLNNDGLMNEMDRNGSNLLLAQTYLLAAEATVEAGNTVNVVGYVNRIYHAFGQSPVLTEGATAAEIRSAVKSAFDLWDAGIKFPNKVRWGETVSWDRCVLLPVPQQALDTNTNLMQNTGW